jgi:hypothetical protein
MISLRETAKRHEVSPGGLSKAVHAERQIEGMALHKYAVLEDGKISGFDFPTWYTFPNGESTEECGSDLTTVAELCDKFQNLTRGKVEYAIREGRSIDGNDVADWATFDGEGRLEGLDVPDSADFGPGYFDVVNKTGQRGSDDGDTKTGKTNSQAGGALALAGAVGLSAILNS